MKRWQFSILLTLGVLCLCLSLVTIVFGRQNRQLQETVQAQQTIINKGALSQQIGATLLREMAAAAPSDDKMGQWLRDNGYNLSSPPPAAPSP